MGSVSGEGFCACPKPSSVSKGGKTATNASVPRFGRPRAIGEIEHAAQHVDKQSRHGGDDHAGLAVTWKRTIQLPSSGATVTSGVPSVSRAQVRSPRSADGSARTCREIRDFRGNGKFAERTGIGKRRQTALPSQRATQITSAHAQFHGHEVVRVCRHARAGKTQQHATIGDERDEARIAAGNLRPLVMVPPAPGFPVLRQSSLAMVLSSGGARIAMEMCAVISDSNGWRLCIAARRRGPTCGDAGQRRGSCTAPAESIPSMAMRRVSRCALRAADQPMADASFAPGAMWNGAEARFPPYRPSP